MSETHASARIPGAGLGRDCVISRNDLEVLLRGAESEREMGYRNLFTGVAASCGFGTVSVIALHFHERVSVGAEPVEAMLLILLAAVTLASGVLAVFFHRRLRTDGSHGTYRLLDRHIRAQLKGPAEPNDPRRWP